MPLVAAKCTECGGSVQVDSEKKAAVCESCGNAFIVEEAINNFNNNYFKTANITDSVVNIYEQKDAATEQSLIDYAYSFINENVDEAENKFREVLQINPQNAKAWKGLYDCEKVRVYREYIVKLKPFSYNNHEIYGVITANHDYHTQESFSSIPTPFPMLFRYGNTDILIEYWTYNLIFGFYSIVTDIYGKEKRLFCLSNSAEKYMMHAIENTDNNNDLSKLRKEKMSMLDEPQKVLHEIADFIPVGNKYKMLASQHISKSINKLLYSINPVDPEWVRRLQFICLSNEKAETEKHLKKLSIYKHGAYKDLYAMCKKTIRTISFEEKELARDTGSNDNIMWKTIYPGSNFLVLGNAVLGYHEALGSRDIDFSNVKRIVYEKIMELLPSKYHGLVKEVPIFNHAYLDDHKTEKEIDNNIKIAVYRGRPVGWMGINDPRLFVTKEGEIIHDSLGDYSLNPFPYGYRIVLEIDIVKLFQFYEAEGL